MQKEINDQLEFEKLHKESASEDEKDQKETLIDATEEFNELCEMADDDVFNVEE